MEAQKLHKDDREHAFILKATLDGRAPPPKSFTRQQLRSAGGAADPPGAESVEETFKCTGDIVFTLSLSYSVRKYSHELASLFVRLFSSRRCDKVS